MMQKLLLTAVVALCSAESAVLSGEATSQCRAADAYSANMIGAVKRIVSGTDARAATLRESMHLPSIDANQVTLINDEKICAKVIHAYAAVPDGYSPGRLYVLKLGNEGYVAVDPERKSGEYTAFYVFDTKFVRIGGWAA